LCDLEERQLVTQEVSWLKYSINRCAQELSRLYASFFIIITQVKSVTYRVPVNITLYAMHRKLNNMAFYNPLSSLATFFCFQGPDYIKALVHDYDWTPMF
jgi:hypothetical protein